MSFPFGRSAMSFHMAGQAQPAAIGRATQKNGIRRMRVVATGAFDEGDLGPVRIVGAYIEGQIVPLAAFRLLVARGPPHRTVVHQCAMCRAEVLRIP